MSNQAEGEMNATTEVAGTSLEPRKRGTAPARFVFSAAAILAVTGVAKLWSGLGHTKILATVDPITGVPFGQLLLAVGVAELLIVGVCLIAKSQTLKLGLIACLATDFVVYRLGLWWIGWKQPCGCMGSLTDALHISPQMADNIMKGILAYLLIGSYGLLIWQWRSSKAKMEGGGLKMAGKGLEASPSGAVSES